LRSRRRGPEGAQSASGAVERVAELREVAVELIDVPRNPARRLLGDIQALAESMHDYGLQQPISVRSDGQRFKLTSGLRRLTAARLLGWTSIPAFVRSLSSDEAYLVDLIENLQRKDLSPEEEADALRELVRTRGWTLQQLAAALKRSVGYVSKRVRVFEDPVLREAIATRGLPVSTAEELLSAPAEERSALIERAIAEHWDQIQARDALRPADSDEALAMAAASLVAAAEHADQPPRRARGSRQAARDASRPRGFTRAVREFHRAIVGIRAEELTASDRAALRSLFRDLVLLARAPDVRTTAVFPPLPTVSRAAAPGPGRRKGHTP
jgi:ParB/RepB/Spo0J family partition protein